MPDFIRTYDLNVLFREPNSDGHPSHIKPKRTFITAAVLDLAHKHEGHQIQYKMIPGYPKQLDEGGKVIGLHIVIGPAYAFDMPFIFYAMQELLEEFVHMRKEKITITSIIDDLDKLPSSKIPEENEIILDLILNNIMAHPATY